jgi:predicted nucleic acid-binding protein
VYTLDTNTIIYYIKGEERVVEILDRLFSQPQPIYVSAITELELFSFSKMSSQEVERIEEILKTLAVIPVDSRIARIAGSLRQKYHLKVPDSAIAATALFTGTTLVTRNIKDFKKIPNLKILKI